MDKCRTCGKEYTPCCNTNSKPGVYRWREVACSPECGEIYLQKILESRGLAPVKECKCRTKKARSKAAETVAKKAQSVENEVVTDSEVNTESSDPNRD